MEAARARGIPINESSLCGGGAKFALWRKILSNVLNVAITIPQTLQGSDYGAAMLAMVGAGEYASVKICAGSFVQVKETVLPDPEIAARYEAQYRKFRKIYPSMKTLVQEICSDMV